MYVSTQNAEKYESAPKWWKRISIFLLVGLFTYSQMVQAEGLGISISQEIEDLVRIPADMLADIVAPILPNFAFEPEYEWNYKSLEKEVHCLAQNIYFESAHEPREGQVAVALVTINRVKSPLYPKSICEVVWQKNRRSRDGKVVAQFSWTNDGKPDRPRNMQAWENSLALAEEILEDGRLDNVDDFTNGATHYHATYVKPRWRHQMEQVVKIGLHIFYRDPKAIGTDA